MAAAGVHRAGGWLADVGASGTVVGAPPPIVLAGGPSANTPAPRAPLLLGQCHGRGTTCLCVNGTGRPCWLTVAPVW